MSEPDDRLAGDLVWELFPQQASLEGPNRVRVKLLRWLTAGVFVVAAWFLSPASAVVLASMAFSVNDVRKGRHLARMIPDKAGGGICALFTYAWAAWKFGAAAFVMMVCVILSLGEVRPAEPPPVAFATAALSWLGGFLASFGPAAAVGRRAPRRPGLLQLKHAPVDAHDVPLIDQIRVGAGTGRP